jgi:hypothetical protein
MKPHVQYGLVGDVVVVPEILKMLREEKKREHVETRIAMRVSV